MTEREKNKALDLQALHAVCEDICPPAKVPLKPGEKVYDFDGFVPDSDLWHISISDILEVQILLFIRHL